MDILVAIVLGAFVGWIASIVMKRDNEQGWIGNIVIGILGAFVGSVLSRVFTGQDLATVSEFSFYGLFWSFIGAIVLLGIVNLITRKSVR